MNSERKNLWIKTGYSRFAVLGDSGITVEAVARDLGKNKSSFYHYFGEIPVFRAQILDLHIERSAAVGNKIKTCKALDPCVLEVIVEHKEDFFFHRQLRLESGEVFKSCYQKAYDFVQSPLLDKLTQALGLENKQLFSSALLNLAVDNFLLRIKENTLTIEWLRDYLKELHALARHMR